MNKLGLYLKELLKKRNIKLYIFEKLMETSKTMMYRIMIGEVSPNRQWLEKVSSVLELSDEEYKKLMYSSTLLEIDDDMLKTRDDVFNTLYTENKKKLQDIDIIYYDDQKLAKSFSNILDDLLILAKNDKFNISFKLVNCEKQEILTPIFNLLAKFDKDLVDYEIEHLISFSNKKSERAFETFSQIFFMLALKNYSAKYNEEDISFKQSLFNDFLIVQYDYINSSNIREEKSLFISFFEYGLSTCYTACKTDSIYEYFLRNYNQVSRYYPKTLKDNVTNMYDFNNFLAEMEAEETMYTFNPTPCYSKIPMCIYEQISNDFTDEGKAFFFKNLLNSPTEIPFEELPSLTEILFASLDLRLKASLNNPHIDIYTCAGLESFAKTGELSDHKNGLPKFSKEQRKIILENIIEKDKCQKDKFSYYIVDAKNSGRILNDSMYILVSSSGTIFLEYNITENEHLSFIRNIEQDRISRTLIDFCENYIVPTKTMSKESAHAFMLQLIQKYCS